MHGSWLLLRGLAREQRHWGAFPSVLERETGLSVSCIDLPGVGTERHRSAPWSVAGMVEDVRARWLPSRTGGPWHLLAVSLGGMVAQQWCATHPGDFSSVVLINSSAGNLSKPWERMLSSTWASVLRAFRASDPEERERIILRMTSRSPAHILDEHARTYATFARERPARVRNVVAQIAAAARFRAPQTLPMPVLVLSSARDGLASPRCSAELARHLRAPLAIHPSAGHDLTLDDPQWVAREIARSLVPPSASSG